MISFIDVDEEHVMHLESDNIEVMPYDNANEVVHKLFEHFFQDTKLVSKHQLETERERERERERDFVFDSFSTVALYMSQGGSCIDSPD